MTVPDTGRFKLIRHLGAGGVGVVFEAYDRQREQRVALKQLRSVTPTGVYRLQREFDILRGISHPNVIELYEFFSDEHPPFITMELIEGRDFCSYVRGHKADTRATSPDDDSEGSVHRPLFADLVNERRLRKVLGHVAHGLHAIHQKQVIHRDLKPSNVLVTDAGRAVVMDFSIAAQVRTRGGPEIEDGGLIGTFGFMAPEQAAGDSLTPAIDWYAFGTMIYLAISGRLPFEGTRSRVIEAKQAYDPIPIADLVSSVPDDLADLCMGLLSRHPHQRPSSQRVFVRLGEPLPEGMNKAPPVLIDAAFVARTQELWHLQGAFQGAASGTGRCVLVSGGSGSGKTRLLHEFMTDVSEDSGSTALLLNGRCYPDDPRCFNAFDDVIESLSQILAGLGQEQVKELLPFGSDLLPRMFPALLRVPSIDRASRRRECNLSELRINTISVLTAMIGALALWKPLVICIDDVQWADRDSVEMLREVFGAMCPNRVLLVLAMRTAVNRSRDELPSVEDDHGNENYDPRPDIEAFARRRTYKMELGELSLDDRERLWERLSERHPVLAEYSDVRSGVPLLLVERANSILEGVLDGGRAEGTDSLDDIFARRIASLGGASRELLDSLVLMKSPMPLSLLVKAADLSSAEGRAAANRLQQSRLVQNMREGREPWLVFAREEIRTIVTSQLSDERTRSLYHRLVRALESSGKATNASLAVCWTGAGDMVRARSYLELAAKSARDRLAFSFAARAHQAALVSEEPDSSSKMLNLLAMAEQLSWAGRFREVAVVYQRISDAGDRAEVDLRVADHLVRAGDVATGIERLVAYAAQLGVPVGSGQASGRVTAMARNARLKHRRRRYNPRHEDEIAPRDLSEMDDLYRLSMVLIAVSPREGLSVHLEHLLRVFQHCERYRVTRALAADLMVMSIQGTVTTERAEQVREEVLVQADERNDPHAVGLVHLGVGIAYRWQGGLKRAESEFTRAIDTLAGNTPDAHWELAFAHYFHCMARIDGGGIRRERRRIERVVENAQRSGDVYRATLFGCMPTMWSLMREHRPADGLEVLDELERSWIREEAFVMRDLIEVTRAMAWVYIGRADRAAEALGRCTIATRKKGIHRALFETERRYLQARVAVLQRDDISANQAAKQLYKLDTELGSAHSLAIRASLAHMKGDISEAKHRLERASRSYLRVGAMPFVMSCKFRMGQLIGGDAGSLLQAEAKKWYQGLGTANVKSMLEYLSPWPSTESSTDARERRQ